MRQPIVLTLMVAFLAGSPPVAGLAFARVGSPQAVHGHPTF